MRPLAFSALPRTLLTVLGIICGIVCAAAQEKPETTQLKAITVDMRGGPESHVYILIWKEAFEAELAKRMAISKKTKRPIITTTDVFEATFDSPEGKILLSATATPETDCRSYKNIGLSPNIMTCPMKVALVRGNDVNVIYSKETFPFSISVDKTGAFNYDKDNTTFVDFDPRSKTIRTQLFENGVHKVEPNAESDDTEISLKY